MDAVAAIESRGFIFAAPFALRRGLPLILLRKKGKLPGETYRHRVHPRVRRGRPRGASQRRGRGQRILLVDDLIATGLGP